ncbi:MAG TPA: histidine triad nucleotide-binding protein [Lacipirellulaceae bacterium]|nr:histidine triad nucleotide-binding protein [Lacipirellulaceae bacterium]
MPTLFTRIINREIPAEIVYEDQDCVAFCDVAPQAPTHVLVIPRKEVASLDALTDEDAELAGRLLLAVARLARALGVAEAGYRVVVNTGADGGQTVDHLHFHLLAGRPHAWPPG